MSKTLETIEKIQRSARHMPEVRVITGMKIGQVVRQGDIYIERVAAIEGKGKAIASRQLAPGTSKGSRHIVSESEAVTLCESKPSLNGKAAFQIGAAIEAQGDVTVTHPEHAWIKIIGDKVKQFYQVFFQADYARKERAKD
jgi:hypothetical protein